MGTKAIENNEYFNELANYRVYPYINFKDFKDYGFSIQLNKTVSAVRSVSFEKSGDFRQNKYAPLQMRVGSKDEFVNIVGFIVPSNITPVECFKIKDMKNIHNYGKNGYDLTLSYISEGTLKNTPHKSSIFWLFDIEKDIISDKTYAAKTRSNSQEHLKKLISKFYDDILIRVYDEFSRKIDLHKEISLQHAKKILENLEKRTLKIKKNQDLLNNIEEKIINKTIIKEEKYDEKEDIFYGLSGNIKVLPKLEKKSNTNSVIKFDVSKGKESSEIREIEKVEGICQHNITWELISKLKKVDEKKYQEKIYEFIQDYVIENNESDFICKSCSTQIDVKKFVEDGTFDDDSGKFVTFSMPFDTPLEDMSEYEKYKIAIRSLDKLIEKIAIINNIPAYTGNIYNSRIKRKNISKDLIDISIDNNHFLKKNLKERNELANKSYGITRELSNLFVFDFENSIFVFSSKEKDYYKNIKYNNILAYIIILLALDLNDSQLSFMIGDKKGLCNINVYDKYGHVLFDNLKIRKNKAGDTVPIKNYTVLCYIIYLISCMMTKYSMWNYEKEDSTKKKFNPIIQKIIIHTVVDLLNSILENSLHKKAGMIFEIISTKFYLKLNSFFNNSELYKRLKTDDNTSIASDRKTFILPKTSYHQIVKYEPLIDYELPKYNKVKNNKYVPKLRKVTLDKYYEVNNITNCEDGKFHNWKVQGKTCICDNCSKDISELKLDSKAEIDKIIKNNKNNYLQKLTRKYCISGEFHKFIKNKNGENICKLCNKTSEEKYSNKDLDDLSKNLLKKRLKVIKSTNDLSKDNDEKIISKLEDNYKKALNKNNSINYYLEEFINRIEENSGELEIKDIYLRDNIYIIDHSYDGNKLEKPIVLTDKDNKIIFKQKHTFFKTDVLTYSFNKSSTNKIEVFYDAISKTLLGYKETSKDYAINPKTEFKIKVNYSLLYKLKYLGLESNFIDIYSRINDLIGIESYKNMNEKEKEDILEEAMQNISRERIRNLKKVIYDIQRFINQIKNQYSTRLEEKKLIKKQMSSEEEDHSAEEEYEETSQFEKTLEKYAKKLTDIKTSDSNNDYSIFEKWNVISDNITSQLNIKDYRFNLNIDETSKIIEADEIIKFDSNSNLLMYYIISELVHLFDFNTNKFIKNNLVGLSIELINYLFNLFNMEFIHSDISVKRLEYILKGLIFAEDLENVISEIGSGDQMEEEIDVNNDEEIEQYEDAREEEDALDVDGEYDYISNYERLYE